MRTVSFDKVVSAVRDICIEAACKLPGDVFGALKTAAVDEKSPRGKAILDQCIDNAIIAGEGDLPICQDTGSSVFFVRYGSSACLDHGTIGDAINEGTARGYREGYLRKSIVADPLFDRKNTTDNTPACIHLEIVPGDEISITILPKGGGCENMSALAMLKPSDGRAGIVDFVTSTVVKAGGNPCPPVIVGVGIGGTADKASLIAKKALLRDIGSRHADQRYADLELEMLDRINASGVGPQGLGGTITALAVHIETFPCHIASLPVAVNLNCHAARKKTVTL